jgi:elongation factor P
MSGFAEGQKFRKTALKVIASSIRKGNIIEQDGRLYVVLTAENIHPGKGTPVSQIEMRRIGDGVKVSERYKTTDQVEKATVEDTNFNYLYEDADGFHFMNTETYDQVQLPKAVLEEFAGYLKDGMMLSILMRDAEIVTIDFPQMVELEIVETEDAAARGDTARAFQKRAKVETGAEVMVPGFIKLGDRVKIDTTTGKYVERV